LCLCKLKFDSHNKFERFYLTVYIERIPFTAKIAAAVDATHGVYFAHDRDSQLLEVRKSKNLLKH